MNSKRALHPLGIACNRFAIGAGRLIWLGAPFLAVDDRRRNIGEFAGKRQVAPLNRLSIAKVWNGRAPDDCGIVPLIPPKANRVKPRETDFALSLEPNLIERFFNKIKHYRAIATRYDKLAYSNLAAIQ